MSWLTAYAVGVYFGIIIGINIDRENDERPTDKREE